MIFDLPIILVLAFFAATICALVLTSFARRLTFLDEPNERSSHTVPTPRGGGLVIVATSSVGFAIMAWTGRLDFGLSLALLGGGLIVAAVGFLDDWRGLSARFRLIAHLIVSMWAVFAMDRVPLMQVGAEVIDLNGWWQLVNVVAVVWVLNLFNFMDGIDGMAGSEAVFIALAGGLLAVLAGVSSGVGIAACILAGATTGFLAWNWPPAKIFMGDVGSAYLGYVIAILGLAAAGEQPAAIPVWLLLGSLFFVDATVTLVRRIARGDRVYEAHRIHAYQWLARRWGSHKRVTVALIILNLSVLLPAAVWCTVHPEHAIYIVPATVAALGSAALLAGSGRDERSPIER